MIRWWGAVYVRGHLSIHLPVTDCAPIAQPASTNHPGYPLTIASRLLESRSPVDRKTAILFRCFVNAPSLPQTFLSDARVVFLSSLRGLFAAAFSDLPHMLSQFGGHTLSKTY